MAESSKSGSRHHAYSRKQKSLGLLCSNFVSLYNRDDVETVGLDDAALKLGVERRRIYDIVNVMESVGVLARKAKNRYMWIGFKGIPGALKQLQEEALKEQNGSSSGFSAARFSDDEDDVRSLDQIEDEGEGRSCTNDTAAKNRSVLERKEKSLGQLTQNFVKLLLTTNADMVPLDEAARLLLGDGQEPSNMRNANAAKVRRLYDIANVLSSLNLIEKTHQCDTRKPAFRWLGTSAKKESSVTVALPPTQHLGKRTFGTELTNVDVKRKRLVTTVEKKPINTQIPSQDLKECNIAVQRELQSSKSFVFGPFNPPQSLKKEVSDQKAKNDQPFESLASSLRPSYQSQVFGYANFGPYVERRNAYFGLCVERKCPAPNLRVQRSRALHELFTHYLEAYNSWFAEITGGSINSTQQPFKKSSTNQNT